MNATERIEPDPDWNWLYRAGGISAIVLGLAYVAIVGLYVPGGAPPRAVEGRLIHLAGNTGLWWAILDLSVLTDFLFIPLSLALYFALRTIDKNAMLLATACVVLFVVLDLSITWTNYASLIGLSGDYAAAADETQREAILTAARYPAAILESSLLFVYNTMTLAVGILLTGIVMLKGVFSRATAYLGIATGVLGIASVAISFFVHSFIVIIVLASVATTLWVFFAGVRLYGRGRSERAKND